MRYKLQDLAQKYPEAKLIMGRAEEEAKILGQNCARLFGLRM